MLYVFFSVISRSLKFMCRRFGTLCSIVIGIPAYEDGTECSETSAYKIQTLGNYPEEKHTISFEEVTSASTTVPAT
jgi:hypothetical protein